MPDVGPNTGIRPGVVGLADACTDELAAFSTKVSEVLGNQVMDYKEDAENQKVIVATDFFTVLETTLFKIHDGLADITDEERAILTAAMVTARDNFGGEVNTWSS